MSRTSPPFGTVAGDFHEVELAAAMDKAAITGDIVETWLRRGEGRSTFCFCVNRRHAQHMAERFLEAEVAGQEFMNEAWRREDARRCSIGSGWARPASSPTSAYWPQGVDLDVHCSARHGAADQESHSVRWESGLGRGLRTAEEGRTSLPRSSTTPGIAWNSA